MERHLDNSLTRLGRSTAGTSVLVLNITAVAVLFACLVAAIAGQHWLIAMLVTSAIAAVIGYSVVSAKQRTVLLASQAVDWVDWKTALPEIQKQNLNIAVSELSRILDVGRESMSDLQSAFLVAEDLALRQIQQEEQVPLLRHVSVCGVPFDAVFLKDGVLHCCEVSFLVSPDVSPERLKAIMKKISTVDRSVNEINAGLSVRLMPILITQMDGEGSEKLRRSLDKQLFSSAPVDIDIRLLDFEILQRIYVNER